MSDIESEDGMIKIAVDFCWFQIPISRVRSLIRNYRVGAGRRSCTNIGLLVATFILRQSDLSLNNETFVQSLLYYLTRSFGGAV